MNDNSLKEGIKMENIKVQRFKKNDKRHTGEAFIMYIL